MPLRPSLLLGLALVLPCAACGDGARPRRPDVVLVLIDTLRADRLGCYGYERGTTPRLDRLAAEGVLFEDVTAQAAWTLPSMVSILSGRYLTEYRDAMLPDAPTLAETFRAAGYRTVGLVGNFLLHPRGAFDRGFDHYDATGTEDPDSPDAHPRELEALLADLEAPLADALAPAADGARPPLFLYLHALDPHDPYRGDAALDPVLPPEQAPPVLPEGWQEAMLARWGPPAPTPPPSAEAADGGPAPVASLEDLRRERGMYDQDVRRTDAWIGRALDRLGELGVLEHAVVAVVSDHGEHLWERLGVGPRPGLKRLPLADFFYQEHGAYLYREAVFTPFLLSGAGVPRGVRIARPVENVDLFPTLLELCDVPARGALHGRSLVPLLRGEEPDEWRGEVYAANLYFHMVRDVASGEKLIVPTEIVQKHGGIAAQLYDLAADPLEREDRYRADDPRAVRLQALLDAWVRDHPTDSNLGHPRTPEELQALEDLGYAAEHTGEGL